MNENDWTRFILENVPMFKSYSFDTRIWDRTRPDMSGPAHVYEVDWSSKWKEGVGQACFYSGLTGKRGGLLLLFPDGINSEKERLRGYRATVAARSAKIDLIFWDCRTREICHKRIRGFE